MREVLLLKHWLLVGIAGLVCIIVWSAVFATLLASYVSQPHSIENVDEKQQHEELDGNGVNGHDNVINDISEENHVNVDDESLPGNNLEERGIRGIHRNDFREHLDNGEISIDVLLSLIHEG